MRYELNFDEDKIIDIEAIGDDGVLDLNDCCKIMNEQQDTITELESDKAIAEDYANIFEKENVKLRKKLNNYKATDDFKWQIRQCEKWSAIVKQLKEENKELRKELDNFKPVMFQDVRKGTVILYSKD